MQRQRAIVLGIAVLIGLVAVYLANLFFSGVQQRSEAAVQNSRLTKIAVASNAIGYAGGFTNTNVVLADWPAGLVPPGAFDRLDVLANRVALQPMVPGEPILASRVSGKDGRATLGVTLPAGKVAVSVPINDVSGVSGFVRPGDVVDVLLTRQIPGGGANGEDRRNDVLLQAVPVLGIDQVLDQGKTDPALGKTATLEVDPRDAQRLALARELGAISLALRNIATRDQTQPATITAKDLGGPDLRAVHPDTKAVAVRAPRAPTAQPVRHLAQPMMTIIRKGKPTDYEVSHVD